MPAQMAIFLSEDAFKVIPAQPLPECYCMKGSTCQRPSWLFYGHGASKWQSWDKNPGSFMS